MSDKMVWPEVYAAVRAPVLVTAIVHVQFEPSAVLPLTLFVFTATRSGRLILVVAMVVSTLVKLPPETVP